MGATACPQRRRLAGRTLYLIDVENLVDDLHSATGADAVRAIRDVLDATGWRLGDQVRIAANPGLACEFMWDL